MGEIINSINSFVWGPPLIILLLGTGVYLTFLLRGLQLRQLFPSLYIALIQRKESSQEAGDISHFQALMTALAATVGTGNIAGVAAAIAMGGPGALFWMWITGLFGMATKFSEAVLAVKYREVDALGTMSGGPMYYIEKGVGSKWLARLFAVFASLAAFGIGNMVQANSVAEAVNATFGLPVWVTALILVVISGLVILGGIKNIARATSAIVPTMVLLYITAALIILVMKYDQIPHALGLIFQYAFTPAAGIGGFTGAAVMQTIRMGVARGIFSNESGLGSSPIAAAAAKTHEPVRQALVSMTQTFIDTIVVCSMTGLVIIVTGAWTSGETGAALTEKAFSMGLPGNCGGIVVTLGLVFFAYSTILGWSYYGEKAIEYLFGEKSIPPYRVIWIAAILAGSLMHLDVVWGISDIMNGLMAFPNLVALILLSGVVASETKKYFEKYK